MNQTAVNFHLDYMDVTSQHWHSGSATYAGGDNLLTALSNSWKIDGAITVVQHWFAGMRYVNVYHFHLVKGSDTLDMPVLHTPYVHRFINDNNLVLQYEDKTFEIEFVKA